MSSRSPLIWLLLAAPALRLLWLARAADADLDLLTADSGNLAAWGLVAALAVTPLLRLVPMLAFIRPHRRAIGLAAFGTALVHLGFYGAVMGEWAAIRAEVLAPGIWTGWAALALLLPLAITSSDAATRRLGRNWKRLQRLVYPAALLTFFHMGLVHNGWRAAVWLAVPLLALELTRFFPPRFRRISSKDPA